MRLIVVSLLAITLPCSAFAYLSISELYTKAVLIGPNVPNFNSSIADPELLAEILANISKLNFTKPDVSLPKTQCQLDQAYIGASASLFQIWALKYFDAQAKVPAGIFEGALSLWYGDFDECLAIPRTKTNFNDFGPKYCYVGVSKRNITDFQDPTLVQFFPALMYGLCVPDSCSERDVTEYMNDQLMGGLHSPPELTHCAQLPPPLDGYAIMAITIFSIVSFFLMAGLIVDVYIRSNAHYHPDQMKLTDKKRSTTIKGHFASLLLAFSPFRNFEKLYRFPNTPVSNSIVPDLSCINAIRSISLFMVLLGHYYSFTVAFYDNFPIILDMSTRFSFQIVVACFFAVDSFFFLSGFLAYWSLSKVFSRIKTTKNFLLSLPAILFHRLVRIVPPYAAAIVVDVALWKYLGDGPFYFQKTDTNCLKNWWTNFLFINNFIDEFQNCLPWSWYLAVDMQFFILAPFIVYAFIKKPVLGWAMVVLAMAGLIVSSVTLTVVHNLPAVQYPAKGYLRSLDGAEPKDFQGYIIEYYGKPYCRIGPYLVGLVACHLLVQHRNFLTRKIFKNALLTHFMWIFNACLLVVLVFGHYGFLGGFYVPPTWLDAVYNALARTAWALVLCWLVISCSLRHGGPVASVMSWPLWQLPARLSYSAYLIHPFVFMYYAQTSRRPLHLTDLSIIFGYSGNVVCVMLVATVFTLAFESPIIGLMKRQ